MHCLLSSSQVQYNSRRHLFVYFCTYLVLTPLVLHGALGQGAGMGGASKVATSYKSYHYVSSHSGYHSAGDRGRSESGDLSWWKILLIVLLVLLVAVIIVVLCSAWSRISREENEREAAVTAYLRSQREQPAV